MRTVSDVNQSVVGLWEHNEDQLRTNANPLLKPLVYPEMTTRSKDGLVFVGMNPSFVVKAYAKHLKGTAYECDDGEITEFFTWTGSGDFGMAKCVAIEKIMRGNYEFFERSREIAAETIRDRNRCLHIDLFFNRETSQKVFQKRILQNRQMKDLVEAQLELSAELIELARPRIIIVANAGASREFEQKLTTRFHLKSDEEHGYHEALVGDRTVPVFLGSAMTYMDPWSSKRLLWHIKRAAREQGRREAN